MAEEIYPNIAISQKDFEQYGCPHCGGKEEVFPDTYTWMKTKRLKCGGCQKISVVVPEGQSKSAIGIGNNGGPIEYPMVQKHPLNK